MFNKTERLKKLQDRLFQVEFHDPGTWYFQDVNILEIQGYEDILNEPLVVRKAYAIQYICEKLPVKIKPDELIVGCPNQNSVAWGSTIPKYFTDEERDNAKKHELDECSIWGHHPVSYDKIISQGIIGVKKEVEDALVHQLNSDMPDEMSVNEYRAMLISLDSLAIFASRYAYEALKLAAQCGDEQRRTELIAIYNICNHIPMSPACTLQEAAQSYWLTYCILNSGGEFIPLGRADQYLYPYYRTDIDNNKITEEYAIDIIGSFLVKCNERIIIDTKKAENHFRFGLFSQGVVFDEEKTQNKINETGGYAQRALMWNENEDKNSDANYNFGQSGNDWLMNCMVGGVHQDGSDATNRITLMIIELMHELQLIMPTLGARVHDHSPKEYLTLLARVLRYGQGEPIIYNDEKIIPGMVELGVPLEDARDYCNDGCWETLVVGKSHFSYAHVMNLRCLEWVLFRGKNLINGEMDGIDTGDPLKFESWDEFYQAYLTQMYERIDFQCKRRLENFGLSYMIAPDPLFSALTEDCVKKGRDISQDGARYVFHMILVTGLANTVDAMAAIKKLVFEDKKIAMDELLKALENNWEGYDRLRALVENKMPKFGNDNDYVDEIAVQLLRDFERRVMTWREKQKKVLFPCGIGTFENYAVLGRDTGASSDGRKSGDPLAPNYSPVPGKDLKGPMATIKSITKPDLLRFYAGTPLDMSVNSNEFVGEEGVERLKDVIVSFCESGGQILTITSTNVDDLMDAKIHPENHKGLRIRMGGLSAYFIAMAPAQQDNIIKRFSR